MFSQKDDMTPDIVWLGDTMTADDTVTHERTLTNMETAVPDALIPPLHNSLPPNVVAEESPARGFFTRNSNTRRHSRMVFPSPHGTFSMLPSVVERRKSASSVLSADYSSDSTDLSDTSDTVYEDGFPEVESIVNGVFANFQSNRFPIPDLNTMPPLPPVKMRRETPSPSPSDFLDHTYVNIDPFAPAPEPKPTSKKFWKKKAASLLNVLKKRRHSK